ncbi:Plakophilin-1 [Merluccius polli]|uniref:Plakophilin-1 n=1 Tax=Merluccius polli TaxID=89951 RepID=A0AA47MA41_MERPO|nr:Plakophilin-1 [Merluccius polli]
MLTLDPFKSFIPIGNVDDTSLAVPSVNQYHESGKQRVLEQVKTIKRTKSKTSTSTRNGHGHVSPTSPDSVFIEPFKSLPISINGSGSIGNGLSKVIGSEKNVNRQTVRTAKGFGQMTTVQTNQQYGQGYGTTAGTLRGIYTSRSEPDLERRFTRSKQRLMSNRSSGFLLESNTTGGGHRHQPQPQPLCPPQILPIQPLRTKSLPQPKVHHPSCMNGSRFKKYGQYKSVSGHSVVDSGTKLKSVSGHSVVDIGTKTKVDSGSSGSGVFMDLTMKQAVDCLCSTDPQLQHCGASFIQHSTYVDDKAKQEVFQLKGIPRLVALLHSQNPQVCETASAALRNLSFKDDKNKEAVHQFGGLEEIVSLLKESDSVETHKQLTGLLWNLSSVDSMRHELVVTSLPALMEKVILPYTTGPDRMSNNNNMDPEVFYHATGCLRNFSSGNQRIRQSMRNCRGLVDSLVSYVGDSVEAERPDDKSVENCVCVLHNLTFQLVAEAPTLFQRISALGKVSQAPVGDTGPIGCFSPQSSKVLEAERHFDYPVVEEQHPTGAGWLIHSKTLQSYLSLLRSSQRDDTLEACCGAMQNLTSQPGIVSNVISQIVVNKLNGLSEIAPLLRSPKINLQRNTVALVANLSKNPQLYSPTARKILPEVFGIVAADTEGGTESDDTLSMACQTAHLLTMKEPSISKPLLTYNVIVSLSKLSQNNNFPKSSKAAALLLYNLWADKGMQNFLKKVRQEAFLRYVGKCSPLTSLVNRLELQSATISCQEPLQHRPGNLDAGV